MTEQTVAGAVMLVWLSYGTHPPRHRYDYQPRVHELRSGSKDKALCGFDGIEEMVALGHMSSSDRAPAHLSFCRTCGRMSLVSRALRL